MSEYWPSYSTFPSSGADFEKYVAAIFQDLGYGVSLTPASNDYGADIILIEPLTNKRIAVQAKFYNHTSLGNTPVQEVIGSLSHWGAAEGWVVTNGRFSKNAELLAAENGIGLIDNDGLNGLIEQARICAGDSDGSVLDLSGIDVYVSEGVDAGYTGNGGRSASGNPQHTDTSPVQMLETIESKTYNMQELMIRWACTRTFVNKEISQGLPMRKLSNGRWSITEQEVADWERVMADRRAREKQKSIVLIVVMVVVFLAIAALFFCDGFRVTDYLGSAF